MRSSRSRCRQGVSPGAEVAGVRAGLTADDRAAVQRACQRIIDALTAGYRVPPIRIRVLAQRPADDYGELHGLYEPEDGATPARISVWMRTARKRQVVAFKSFLRTVCHEVCHHLDYELFALEETFHTDGFYKRESSLANALLASEPRTSAQRLTRESAGVAAHRRSICASHRPPERAALCYNAVLNAPRSVATRLMPGQARGGASAAPLATALVEPRLFLRSTGGCTVLAIRWTSRPLPTE